MSKTIVHVHRDVQVVHHITRGPQFFIPGDTTLTYSDGSQESFRPDESDRLNACYIMYAPEIEPNPKSDPMWLGE